MYSVLIVDDEEKIRKGLISFFPWHELQFEVVAEAENGYEALTILETRSIDVVLCDIKMPVMNGIDLAAEIYNKKLPVKVIFFSGYNDFDYLKSAIIYKARNFILKPTTYKDISHVFQTLKEELDVERASLETPPQSEESMGKYPSIINDIKQYVEEHYQTVTLSAIVKVVHFNAFYISKLFKEKTNENFVDYLARVRMKKAEALLRDYNIKVYEVGYLVGYSNPRSFSKAFKKMYGINPTEYRNRTIQ